MVFMSRLRDGKTGKCNFIWNFQKKKVENWFARLFFSRCFFHPPSLIFFFRLFFSPDITALLSIKNVLKSYLWSRNKMKFYDSFSSCLKRWVFIRTHYHHRRRRPLAPSWYIKGCKVVKFTIFSRPLENCRGWGRENTNDKGVFLLPPQKHPW